MTAEREISAFAMAAFVWQDSYDTGIEVVDGQHRRLVDYLNQAQDAVIQGNSHQSLNQLFANLTEYAIYHFETEESLMERVQYPHRAQHKEAHNRFVTEVNRLQKEFTEGSATLNFEVLAFLLDWLNQHILTVDKKMGDYIRQYIEEAGQTPA